MEKARLALGEVETLREYYTHAYLPSVAHCSPNHIRLIGKNMELHVLKTLGDFPLDQIDRAMLQRLFNKKEGLTVSSLRQVKKYVSAVFNLACIDGVLHSNPVSFVRLPAGVQNDKEPLSFDECKSLLYGAHSHTNALVLGLMGLRAGEICAASWGDFNDGALHVQRQVKMDYVGKWHTSDVLKTPQSDRHVPIPDSLLSLMTKNGVLMVGSNPRALWRELKAVAKDCGIETFHTHLLRHTFISLMENELECPRRIVAQIAGKAKKGEMDRYSQSSMRRRKEWAAIYADELTKSTTRAHTLSL